jgi:hypothetical protein
LVGSLVGKGGRDVTVIIAVASGKGVAVTVIVTVGNGKVVAFLSGAQAARSNNRKRIDKIRFIFIHRENKKCAKFLVTSRFIF